MKNAILFGATFVGSFVLTALIRFGLGMATAEAAPKVTQPVTSMPAKDPITMNLKWGGYYAYHEDGHYRVFRLLDINPSAYHFVSYEEKFQEVPNINEVYFLIPNKEHAVRPSVEILDLAPILIGSRKLKDADLLPYQTYLQSRGFVDSEVGEIIGKALTSSTDAPFQMRFSDDGGRLHFGEAF